MLERPDDGVEDQLELRRWDGQERGEAVVVDRLEHHEEVCAVFRELFEVLEKKAREVLINQFITSEKLQ